MQSAYNTQHSMVTALIAVFNSVLIELDMWDSAVPLALLDMSAAFDTVNHMILLRRLEFTFGIRGDILQWFRSYLTNRKVAVAVGKAMSDPVTLECSLPQGSKLGPRSYSDYTLPLSLELYLFYIITTPMTPNFLNPCLWDPRNHSKSPQHTFPSAFKQSKTGHLVISWNWTPPKPSFLYRVVSKIAINSVSPKWYCMIVLYLKRVLLKMDR